MKNYYQQAFPSDYTGNSDREEGMSKRFYAACAAMQGILAAKNNGLDDTPAFIHFQVRVAFQYADELLKQEYEENNN